MMKNKYYENIGESLWSDTLDNGLRVLVLPKPDFVRSFALLAVNYGGAMRRFTLDGESVDTPAGVAHYLEHKMFDMPNGSNVMGAFSALGASPNAFTSAGMTAYHFDTTQSFDECLRLLLKYVSTPYFTPESVEKERGIIGQEIGMIEDDPSYAVYKELLGCLYERHPIRDTVAGTVESIAQISDKTLYGCHRAFYRPSNMALCVEGNVDPDDVARIAAEILSEAQLPPPEPDYGGSESSAPARARTEKAMDVSAPQFLIGCKADIPSRGEDALRSRLTASLALRALMGRSSPFYTKLYAEGLLRNDFDYEIDCAADTATFMAGGESPDPDAVLERLNGEVRRVSDGGLDAEAFERCRRASLGARLRGLEDFGGVCAGLAEGCFAQFDPLRAFELLPEISAGECAEWIKTNLPAGRLALSVVNNGGR